MAGTDSALVDVLRRLTAGGDAVGISAAVVRPERDDTFVSSGVEDIPSGRVATADTAYLWFSMTKIVTATAVMQLAERDALNLDDPVDRFLPEFPRPRSRAAASSTSATAGFVAEPTGLGPNSGSTSAAAVGSGT